VEFGIIELCHDCGLSWVEWLLRGLIAAMFVVPIFLFWMRRPRSHIALGLGMSSSLAAGSGPVTPLNREAGSVRFIDQLDRSPDADE
jgi:hypothetical protein